MSGAKRWLSVFFSLFGGVAGTLGEAGVAELLADLDEFGGQALVATEVGDLLAGGLDLVGAQGAVAGLAVVLEGERPVGAVELAVGGAAVAGGLAAAAGTAGERAGAHVAEAGDELDDAVAAGLEAGDGVGQRASFLPVLYTVRILGANSLPSMRVHHRSAESQIHVVHPLRMGARQFSETFETAGSVGAER